MKRLLNILVITVFINFLALPTLAIFFDASIPQSSIMLSEEETHSSSSFPVLEKTIPKTMNVHDFIKPLGFVFTKASFALIDDNMYLTPYSSIISPPPERFIFS